MESRAWQPRYTVARSRGSCHRPGASAAQHARGQACARQGHRVGDTDLIYHVLLRLKNQLSRGDFFRIVQAPVSDAMVSATAPSANNGGTQHFKTRFHTAVPVASIHLLEAYAKEVDRDLLKDFYYQDDRRTDSAILALQEANAIHDVGESELPDKIFKLKTAMKFFGEDKERVLEAKLVDEQIRLLAFQQALEKEDGLPERIYGSLAQ